MEKRASSVKSIYIHWPFCPYRCHFCPFVALASHDQFMEQYHDALCKEIESYVHNTDRVRLDTIFFGGGTPSTYPDRLLLDMFDRLKKVYDFDHETEVSIEVNPGTVRVEQLEIWKQAGINRLSIGVQSLNDKVLSGLNRHQSAKDVFFLLKHAKDYFTNISVDLILGLPEISEQEWKDLILQVVTWPISHVSVYFLMVHEDTPLFFKVARNMVSIPPDDSIVSLYHWTREVLKAHGFEQYELSNFTKPGFHSRHNSTYWNYKPYKGFGLGACSFDGEARYQNEKNLMKYMTGIKDAQNVISFKEKLTQKQMRLERLMLGLRRPKGVSYSQIMEGYSRDKQNQLQEIIQTLQKEEYIYEHNNYYALTPKGLVVENEIITRLSL